MKSTLFIVMCAATMLYAGDYTFTGRSTSLAGTISGYDNVTANGLDSVFSGAVGAIKNDSNGASNLQFSISGNGDVSLSNCKSDSKGGLFYVNQSKYTSPQTHTTLSICNNSGSVSISNNYAKSYGGAIAADNNSSYPEYYSVTNISGNTGSVTFDSNNSDGSGGAIWSNGVLNINNNGNVYFTGNAVNKANGNWGGAIYMGASTANTLSISGNETVEFRGNYLYKPQSSFVPEATVRLNSIYQKGTNTTNTISAKTGGSVVFYDAIVTESCGSKASYELNADYTDASGASQKAAGTIVFSGKYVQEDLADFAGAVGDVEASQTSTLSANTTLHNGTLKIENNAVLQTKNLTVNGGAQLTLSDGVCATLEGGALLFKDGSYVSVMGSNTLSAQSIIFEGDTNFSLTLSAINKERSLIHLLSSGLTFSQGSLHFEGMDALEEGKYMVFDVSASTLAGMGWSTDELVITGLSSADTFTWNETGTVLYLNHRLIPEPTTATLSLLALAGLAARRRRK